MKKLKNIKIGDRIETMNYNILITGVVTKKLPGAVVIKQDNNGKLRVVNADKIK